jgi:hypothetical protein
MRRLHLLSRVEQSPCRLGPGLAAQAAYRRPRRSGAAGASTRAWRSPHRTTRPPRAASAPRRRSSAAAPPARFSAAATATSRSPIAVRIWQSPKGVPRGRPPEGIRTGPATGKRQRSVRLAAPKNRVTRRCRGQFASSSRGISGPKCGLSQISPHRRTLCDPHLRRSQRVFRSG